MTNDDGPRKLAQAALRALTEAFFFQRKMWRLAQSLATDTSEPCGAETNANPAPSTGKLGPEYLPGDVGGSVADNLTDDQKDGAD